MTDAASGTRPLLLFDGVCNLCNAAVQWIIRRDHGRTLQFASLQSNVAQRKLAQEGTSRDELPDSLVLIDDKGVHTRSSAAIRVGRLLGFPWSLAVVFVVIPTPLRDWAYAFIAKHRYRWFGERETCMTPTPELRDRFLDADESTTS